jgi:predicted ATPase
MYLKTLILNNIRQFEERTFNFQTGFNLLVGENGTGKTTTLKGILAALGNTGMGRRKSVEDDDIRLHKRSAKIIAIVHNSDGKLEEFNVQKTLWKPARRSSYRGKLPLVLLYSSREAVSSAMKTKVTKRTRNIENNTFRSSEAFLYEYENNLSQSMTKKEGRRFGNSNSVKQFVGKMLSVFSSEMDNFYWRFEPYSCSLVIPEGETEKYLLTPEIQKQARAYAMRWFDEMLVRRKQPVIWPDQEKVVLTADVVEKKGKYRNLPRLEEIWKEMDIPPSLREIFLSSSLEVKLTPRIMFNLKIGTLSLHQLSDGEQRLFTLFVDIARQLSLNNSTNTFGEGEAIILIDEIDVHLHPKWQRRIVPALEDLFPNCQFIATTHSPFVIQATRREKIIAIDHKFSTSLEGGNSIEDIAEEIQGISLPQRSLRSENLSVAAKKYFTLLERLSAEPKQVDANELRTAEQIYREASEPFTSDPSLHALLKILAKGGKDK